MRRHDDAALPLSFDGRPRCPFCKSRDSDYSWRRPARIFLLSLVVPGLRRFYCRSCTRHFPGFAPKPGGVRA